MSFSSRIGQLKEENMNLCQEIREWRDRAGAESEPRKIAEEEVVQLQETCQHLRDQVQSYEMDTNYLKSSISRCFQDLDEVLPRLEDLRTAVSFCNTS